MTLSGVGPTTGTTTETAGRRGTPPTPYDPYDPYEDLVERHEEKRYPWDPFDPNENPVERHEERKKNPWDVPCVPYDDLMNPWHPWDPPNEIGFESRKHKPVWSDDSDTIVSYKELEMADNDILIDGDKFHKISFPECDFFIRKPQGDLDNDLYDFREVYVKPPESDDDWIPIPKHISLMPEEVYVKPPESNVYWIPKVLSPMPEEHTRCSIKVFYRCINNEHARRKYPEFKIDDQTRKVFLIKHCENRRVNDPELFLDFEETYVLDGSKKSITRAKVSVTVPEARNRDKLKDMMIRCLKEDSFEITRMYSDYRVD
ncbi:Ras association domain-containing protein [Cinnamomum micranthum f. kanehirae]|uniref:Ras association domain-containing protein n=1 Tax=Cinnamomum micranthum f. kanehirae TaxID=337451 RepID=A0A3S3N7C0_9MAGN|nr:Ras association domain-containing protein [Cinnamomum micranthum f. kanehirae]